MKLRFVPFSVGLLLVGNTRTAVASLIDALYEACGFLLVLHRGAADFIERRLHAIPLQIRHRGQNLGTLHHTILLRAAKQRANLSRFPG